MKIKVAINGFGRIGRQVFKHIENNHADTAIFDIKGLQIQKVTLGQKGNEKNTSYFRLNHEKR